jgi:hypothetical protein
MKTIINVFILMSLLMTGCSVTIETTKDDNDKDIVTYKLVDPVNDLVAFLDPVEEKLFILLGHKDRVIQKLGAEPLYDKGKYKMKAITASGNNIEIYFTLSYVNTPSQIYSYADLYNDLLVGEIEKEDTTRGEPVGTFYRVFKNANFRKVRDAREIPCEKLLKRDSKGKVEYETDLYTKIKFSEENHCFKGSGYCVEALVITKRKFICKDKDCMNVLEIIPYYNYSCFK